MLARFQLLGRCARPFVFRVTNIARETRYRRNDEFQGGEAAVARRRARRAQRIRGVHTIVRRVEWRSIDCGVAIETIRRP